MTQQDRIKAAERRLNGSGNTEARELAEIQAALREDRKVINLQARINAAAPGSVARMRAQYELNRLYLENMSEDERYGTDEGLELEGETGELYRAIRDARKAMNEAVRPGQVTEDEEGANEEEEFAGIEAPAKWSWLKAIAAIAFGSSIGILLGVIGDSL